jgi:predicted permease
MNTIAARLAQQYPADDSQEGIAVSPLHDELVRNVKITLYLLIAAVGLILLIACANVANLLLTKVAVRRREMAIRTALGASRSHIIRQLLAESLVLAILAGALGLVIGSWAAQGLAHVTPAALIANSRIALDWRVALFAFIASLLCTVVFGLAPALQASNADVRGALHAAGSGSVKTGGMGGLRASIVVAEIAMSMALLVGAAILVRSLVALNSVDPGYRVQGLTAMRFSYPAATPDDSKQAVRFYATVLEKGASTPGVRNVAATNALPMESTSDGSFSIAGRPDPEPGDFFKQSADFMLVGPNYFHALGIGFIAGRDFDEHDNAGGQFTCIINQALAQKYFPGQDSIGQRIQTGYDIANFMTVVGVVSGVRQSSLQQPPSPLIYMPYQQHPLPATNMQVIFRDSGSGAAALRSEAHRLNPEVVVDFKPVESVVDESFAPSRFRSGLLSLFAGLALLLAVAGLYGVMSFAVAQRRNEIGVRMALGAQKSHVMKLILGQGLWLVLPGVLFGAALAFGAGKVFVSLVYGVKASDPPTFIASAALLVVVALLAMYIPARRAAGADPMLALRSE